MERGIVRIKECIGLLCGFVILAGVCLPGFSCAEAGTRPRYSVRAEPEAGDAGEPAGLALQEGLERSDPILVAYRDPLFRDWVAAFFGDLTGSPELAAVVLANSEAFNISPSLAFALCWEESRYNPRAVNTKNRNQTIDRGLFQLNSASFPDLGEEDFFNPGVNARYGLAHLRWCLDNAGTEVAGLAMYNAGTGRVRSGGTPKNTLDYISRILRQQRIIEDLFLAGIMALAEAESPVVEEAAPEFRLSLLVPLGRQ
jgi:hypothetical protein